MCGHRAALSNYASARSADPAVGTPPIPVVRKPWLPVGAMMPIEADPHFMSRDKSSEHQIARLVAMQGEARNVGLAAGA